MTRYVPALPKPSRVQSKTYLDWVRRRPCLICGSVSQAHHSISKGARGSDFRAIPLCANHHRELHRLGRSTFEERYRLDVTEEILRLLETYISGRGEE